MTPIACINTTHRVDSLNFEHTGNGPAGYWQYMNSRSVPRSNRAGSPDRQSGPNIPRSEPCSV
ncbi:MAG: hypothetical protein L3J79_10520, partial [Candidatus Marinimicrobia bacterium]|nr:hypothetical protein [Candidatus Neomarinimicrobiota bacterium]